MTNSSPTLAAVLRDLAAFLRRPQVLAPQGWGGAGNLIRWGWLTGLLITVLIGVLLPFLQFWQRTFELPAPSAFGALPDGWLIPSVVIIAPIAEELLFRGWQSGRAAAFWLLGCALVGIAVPVFFFAASPLLGLGLMLTALVAGGLGWWKLRRQTEPLGWFARAFPVIFYLAAGLFALVHLSNYPAFSLLAVPLVLPQLWAALVLGYIRQRIGLIAGIATHMAANGCSLALAMAQS
jgi:membrane protease YdiL (CAAX protease family)